MYVCIHTHIGWQRYCIRHCMYVCMYVCTAEFCSVLLYVMYVCTYVSIPTLDGGNDTVCIRHCMYVCMYVCTVQSMLRTVLYYYMLCNVCMYVCMYVVGRAATPSSSSGCMAAAGPGIQGRSGIRKRGRRKLVRIH